jgi:hypothetical protein
LEGTSAFFSGGMQGMHFVNLTGESKNFKTEFPLNHLHTYYGYLCDLCPLAAFIFSDLNYKIMIFLVKLRVPLNILLEKKALEGTILF